MKEFILLFVFAFVITMNGCGDNKEVSGDKNAPPSKDNKTETKDPSTISKPEEVNKTDEANTDPADELFPGDASARISIPERSDTVLVFVVCPITVADVPVVLTDVEPAIVDVPATVRVVNAVPFVVTPLIPPNAPALLYCT